MLSLAHLPLCSVPRCHVLPITNAWHKHSSLHTEQLCLALSLCLELGARLRQVEEGAAKAFCWRQQTAGHAGINKGTLWGMEWCGNRCLRSPRDTKSLLSVVQSWRTKQMPFFLNFREGHAQLKAWSKHCREKKFSCNSTVLLPCNKRNFFVHQNFEGTFLVISSLLKCRRGLYIGWADTNGELHTQVVQLYRQKEERELKYTEYLLSKIINKVHAL